MDDLQLEKLASACVIICVSLGEAMESAKKAISALAESVVDLDLKRIYLFGEFPRDPFEDLARAMNEMGGTIDTELLQELAEMAEDMPPIIPKKIPRPPKRIGPINKANYAANRPPRRARSSCRVIKR